MQDPDVTPSISAIACNGSVFDENIERGIRWVEEHFEIGGDRRGLHKLYNIGRGGVIARGPEGLGTRAPK